MRLRILLPALRSRRYVAELERQLERACTTLMAQDFALKAQAKKIQRLENALAEIEADAATQADTAERAAGGNVVPFIGCRR